MYPTQTAYTQQTAAHVLKVLSALLLQVKEGVSNPTKVKQQTVNYLAAYEVAVLRVSYPSVNTRCNKAKELDQLLTVAIQSKESLQHVALELAPYLKDVPPVNADYQKIYTAAYPLVGVVLDTANEIDLSVLTDEPLSSKDFTSVKTQVIRFIDEYRKPLKVESVAKRQEGQSKVDVRREAANQRAFKPASLIERADRVLSNLTEYRWEEISCALSLTTGRRMVEIHLSGSYWMPTDEEWDTFESSWVQQVGAGTLPGRSSCIAFKGQAKGKQRKVDDQALKDVVFVFPCLVDPALVLQGIEYLDKKGKRLSPSLPASTVNDRYSRYLSAEIKRNWTVVTEESENTYHKLRAAYFCTTTSRMSLDNAQFDKAAGLLIGDGDMTTIQSYQRYKVSEETD